MARKYSPYFYELEDTDKQRYTEKLDNLGVVDDPYVEEPSIVGEDWKSWPSVEYPDIYNYLIQTPSVYTHESLKATRILKPITSLSMAEYMRWELCKLLQWWMNLTTWLLRLLDTHRNSLAFHIGSKYQDEK